MASYKSMITNDNQNEWEAKIGYLAWIIAKNFNIYKQTRKSQRIISNDTRLLDDNQVY